MLSAASALLIASAVTIDLSARIEGRSATESAVGFPATNAVQLDAQAAAGARLDDFQFRLTYAPRLLYSDPLPAGARGAEIFHTASAGVAWRISRTKRLSLEETASYGHQDFSPLVASPLGTSAPPTDPRLPLLQSLSYLSLGTRLSYEDALTPRLRLGTQGSYLVSGGGDAEAREFLPLQRAAQLGCNLAWTADSRSTFSVSGSANRSTFSGGDESILISGSLGWQFAFRRGPRVAVQAGAGVSRAGDPFDARPWLANVNGGIGIGDEIRLGHQRISGSLEGTVSATIDRLTGDVYQLAQGSAQLGFQVLRELHISAHGSAGRGLSGAQQGSTVALVGLSASIGLFKRVGLSIGGRGAWTQYTDASPGLMTWSASAVVTIAHHERF